MPAIDYTGAAATYRRRRTLPPDILDVWRQAVTPRLADARHVLDVGAGTGQFCRPLAAWAGRVTALEPSAAMRAELAAETGPTVAAVGGRIEAVPLAAGSVDAAWLSTVFHQFDDRAAAVAELARVVRPGGRVLVRGYLSDVGSVGALMDLFPGIERAQARFPSTDDVIASFAGGGFTLVDVVDVVEVWVGDLATWAHELAAVRHHDSMLVPLTDEEVDAGVAAVRAEAARAPGPRPVPVHLRLVTLQR